MINWIKKLFKITKRVDLRFVGYNEADALLHSGWRVARPEEDNNREGFMVWVELRKPDYD